MLPTHILLTYLDKLLQPQLFRDYCPNGLQISGSATVKKIVCGVTASQALIDAAVERQADTLLVHHGYFWKGEDPRIIGIKKQRFQRILQHDLNLIAYHLPLDAHAVYGNNQQLAQQLNFSIDGEINTSQEPALILHGKLATAMTAFELSECLARVLKRTPLHIGDPDRVIQRVAWCTGAAQDFIDDVAAYGHIDAYITGEVSERTYHSATEHNINFYAAGHHATERYGVQALGQHLAEKFAITVEFIDIDNPV